MSNACSRLEPDSSTTIVPSTVTHTPIGLWVRPARLPLPAWAWDNVGAPSSATGLPGMRSLCSLPVAALTPTMKPDGW